MTEKKVFASENGIKKHSSFLPRRIPILPPLPHDAPTFRVLLGNGVDHSRRGGAAVFGVAPVGAGGPPSGRRHLAAVRHHHLAAAAAAAAAASSEEAPVDLLGKDRVGVAAGKVDGEGDPVRGSINGNLVYLRTAAHNCTAPHYKGVSVMDNNCLCVLCIFKGKRTPRLLSVVVGHDDQVDELLLAAVLGKDLGPQDLLPSDIYFCFPASDCPTKHASKSLIVMETSQARARWDFARLDSGSGSVF